MTNQERGIVLITGCTSGIGFETALEFGRKGYETVASVKSFSDEEVVELKQKIKSEGLSVEIIKIDVTDEESIESGVQYVLEEKGGIDILVNNAGFGILGPVELFTIEEIEEQYDVNLFGMLRMVRAVAPHMREKGFGKIINMSSVNGFVSAPFFGMYSSSKFAIETISEVLSYELKPFGISVTIVEPGSFATKFVDNVLHPEAMSDSDSPYKEWTDKFFSRYYEMAGGLKEGIFSFLFDPHRVAQLIVTKAAKHDAKLRYRVGIDTHVYYWLKRFVPDSIWRWGMYKVFRW